MTTALRCALAATFLMLPTLVLPQAPPAVAPIKGEVPGTESQFLIYKFTLDKPRSVEVRAQSEAFDAMLSLAKKSTDPEDDELIGVAEDDDSGGDTNPLIRADLEPGEYILALASQDPSGGPFELTAVAYDRGEPRHLLTTVGELASNVQSVPGVEDDFEFSGRRGYKVDIPVPEAGVLQVDAFGLGELDPQLAVLGPDGKLLGSNDDSDFGMASRVVAACAAGTASAWITPAEPTDPVAGEFACVATWRKQGQLEPLALALDPEMREKLAEKFRNSRSAPKTFIGQQAPDFDLPVMGAPEGTTLKLSDLRGKMVLLDFWETWCAPCVATMPHLETVHKTEAEKRGLVVLGITQGDPDHSLERAKQIGVSYRQLSDREGTVSSTYGVNSIPRLILIDKEGKVVKDVVGSHDLPELLALLDSAAPVTPAP